MHALLQSLVTAQAEHHWTEPAIVFEGTTVTYGDLETCSNQLARVLRKCGCRRGDRIGVLAQRTPEAVVAMLAICKADCTYVPLELDSPPTRVAKIIQRCDPHCLLITLPGALMLETLMERGLFESPVLVGSLDLDLIQGQLFRTAFSMADVLNLPDMPLGYRNWPDDPAYMVFPSTGATEGLVITHTDVRDFVLWANQYFGAAPGDRHGAHAPSHGDVSIADVFGTLAAGAALYPVPPRLVAAPEHLAGFIRQSELTQWCSTPSSLHRIARLDAVGVNDFPALKRVWCGGVFPPPTLRYWITRLPHVTFTSLYGPKDTIIAGDRCVAARAITVNPTGTAGSTQ